MRRRGVFLLWIATALAGCAGEDRMDERARGDGDPAATADRPEAVEGTNTAINERDRAGAYPTPSDQSSNEQDMMITQRIRQAIMEDAALSMMAQNVKIITANGRVTLRGPVESAAERAAIATKAEEIAGAAQVDNLLEIAPE